MGFQAHYRVFHMNNMKMLIENIPENRIAFIRQVVPYGTNNVKTMETLKAWAKSNNLFNEQAVIFGITQDNPETVKPENCRYDTCIVVSNNYMINGDISEGQISGGKYAVFIVEHTAEAVQEAWVNIFPELFNNGYQFDETRPILERYKVKMVNDHLCEICVPVI